MVLSLVLSVKIVFEKIAGVGVTPVAGFLAREGEAFVPYEGIPNMFNTLQEPYPYRGKRSLNYVTNSVIEAIDKLAEAQTETL